MDRTDMALVYALARYLRARPQACDTADGITRWWLAIPPADTDKVQRALDWLEAEGLVESVAAVDGRTRYRRAELTPQQQARFDALGDDPVLH